MTRVANTTTATLSRRYFRLLTTPWFGAAALALVVIGFAFGASTFTLYIVDTCMLACFGAIALNLLQGTAGQVSIGNAGFLAMGAFATAWCVRTGLGFPFDVVVAAVATAVVGSIVGIPALRLRGLTLALATLSSFFIIIFVATEYQSHTRDAGEGGFLLKPLFTGKLSDTQREWTWVLLAFLIATVLVVGQLTRSKAGRTWRFIRDHEAIAPALGIKVTWYKLIAFTISSGLIGVQGALFAHFTQEVSVDQFTLLLAIQYLAMVLIGGLDSILGAIIGASIITALPTVLPHITSLVVGSARASRFGAQYAQIAYGLLLVVFIVSSPNGIVGWLRGIGRSSWARSITARWTNAPSDGRVALEPISESADSAGV